MTEMNISGLNETYVGNQTYPDTNYTGSAQRPAEFRLLYDVVVYIVITFGIPGNILSAIIWLRSSNSSAVYLAALAVNDLAHILFFLMIHQESFKCDITYHRHVVVCVATVIVSVFTKCFEPLLVMAFSVERLIAISRPIQVCYLRFQSKIMCLKALNSQVFQTVYHNLLQGPTIFSRPLQSSIRHRQQAAPTICQQPPTLCTAL